MNSKFGFFLCFLFLLSCAAPTQDEDLSIFRYNQASGIGSLDPIFAKDQATIWACNQLFNGLVQLNKDLEVIPSIAKSWKISEDATRYTFHLRRDVYFHNHELLKVNRKVIASDFTYSFNRLRS